MCSAWQAVNYIFMDHRPVVLFLFLIGCQNTGTVKLEVADVVGVWHADSLYSYENGFELMRPYVDTGPTYTYTESGKVSEEKNRLKREFLYEIQGLDSLVLKTPYGDTAALYQVLQISQTNMALKKSKTPWMHGKNQEMYTILYLSKQEEDLK